MGNSCQPGAVSDCRRGQLIDMHVHKVPNSSSMFAQYFAACSEAKCARSKFACGKIECDLLAC